MTNEPGSAVIWSGKYLSAPVSSETRTIWTSLEPGEDDDGGACARVDEKKVVRDRIAARVGERCIVLGWVEVVDGRTGGGV